MKAKSLLFVCGAFMLLLSGCAASIGPGYGYDGYGVGYGAGYYAPGYYGPQPYYGYGPRTNVIVETPYRHGPRAGYRGGYGGREGRGSFNGGGRGSFNGGGGRGGFGGRGGSRGGRR